MRNVIRRALLTPGQNDRGAIGVLFAVLIAAGVLFGLAAVVVDVGETYAERAELQNGADAGALAVAKACALGSADCSDSTEPTGTAGTYANANAKDALSEVWLVCGYDADQPLIECPATTGTTDSRVDCPELPPSGTEFVDVHTSTRTAGGTTLTPRFGHAQNSDEPFEGTTVGACARAAWGAPAGGKSFAGTISDCEWEQATTGGTDYAPSPPYPPNPDATYSRVLELHDPKEDSSDAAGETCADRNGVDGPGQFGWVEDPDDDCSAYIDEGDSYSTDPGADVSSACKTELASSRENQEPIFIPLYSTVSGTGTNGEYELSGFAAFIVTGYHLPSFKAKDWLTGTHHCTGSQKCIYGFFIDEEYMPGGGSIGGADRGVYTAKLTG